MILCSVMFYSNITPGFGGAISFSAGTRDIVATPQSVFFRVYPWPKFLRAWQIPFRRGIMRTMRNPLDSAGQIVGQHRSDIGLPA